MSGIEKAVIGGFGGLCAVLVKFLGQDFATVVAHASNLTPEQLLGYKIGYGLLTPILMFLGAFIAWISDERKRMKLVAIAIAAPAMITTWSGGQKLESRMTDAGSFVTIAYADSVNARPGEATDRQAEQSKDKGTLEQIQKGIGIFFGYGKEPKKYWVIVGSFKDKNEAQQFADRINAESDLNAWIGLKLPDNDYYPVIVGEYSYLSEAKALKQRALATKTIKDAYLSTGERR